MRLNVIYNKERVSNYHRSHLPRYLRRHSAAVRLMVFRVRIPPGSMSVSSEWCMLSGRGLYDGMITRPEGSYRVFVSECDREASTMRGHWATRGCCVMGKKKSVLWIYISEQSQNEETHHSTLFNFAIVSVCRRVQKTWKRWNFIWHFSQRWWR